MGQFSSNIQKEEHTERQRTYLSGHSLEYNKILHAETLKNIFKIQNNFFSVLHLLDKQKRESNDVMKIKGLNISKYFVSKKKSTFERKKTFIWKREIRLHPVTPPPPPHPPPPRFCSYSSFKIKNQKTFLQRQKYTSIKLATCGLEKSRKFPYIYSWCLLSVKFLACTTECFCQKTPSQIFHWKLPEILLRK